MVNEKTIEKMNEFLRGEVSAVETYDLALGKTKHTELVASLQQLRDEHAHRIALIRQQIRAWNGEPSEGSGVWGTFAKAVQAGADLLGDATAIAALEEGEDHGLRMYRDALADTDIDDAACKSFVSTVLLPAEQKSHDACRSLKRFAKAATT
jgi:demethoxyubiquinone hydroxylase (CLK1/Coq7/Cat5 family)